jgi:hypothetical protein
MTHIERRRRSAKHTGRDVRDGELIDWSHRGVPNGVEVYRHSDGIVALWWPKQNRHVAAREDSFTASALIAALRNLGCGVSG